MTVRPKVIYLADPALCLLPDEFKARWLQHGKFAMSLPIWRNMWKYAQCDPITVGGFEPACQAVGLVWYQSWQALESIAKTPSLREPILADELQTFSGPVRQRALLTEEITLVDGPETEFKLFRFEREASDDGTALQHPRALRVLRSNAVSNDYTSSSTLPYKSVLELYFADLAAAAEFALELERSARTNELVLWARERRLYGPGS
jgi:hypothetical protein